MLLVIFHVLRMIKYIDHKRSPFFSVVLHVLIISSESKFQIQEFGLKYEYVRYVSNFVGCFLQNLQWFSCMKTKIDGSKLQGEE